MTLYEIFKNTYINPDHIVEIVPDEENSSEEALRSGDCNWYIVKMVNGSVYHITDDERGRLIRRGFVNCYYK